MPFLQNQQNPFMVSPMQGLGGMPQQQGLMANPAAFQFLSAMMNQPGGFDPGAIPGYGTQNPFGVPMYLPEVISPRTYQPNPVATVSAPVVNYGGGGGGGGTRQGSEK